MTSRPTLAVGICTYRRASLAGAIESVDAQVGVRADRIVVADNDETPSAGPLIDSLRQTIRTPIDHIHAPMRNIAVARNACLDAGQGGWLAFLDDDETAPPDWLATLTDAMDGGIAAVFAASIALYPEHAPEWMKTLAPHSQFVQPAITRGGTEIMSGHTANCLIDMTHPVMKAMRFGADFGQRQSEDSRFFFEAYEKGARFRLIDGARVTEPVPEGRLSADWLMKRRFRHGRAYGHRMAGRGRLSIAVGALVRAGVLGSWGVLSIHDAAVRWRQLLRASFHAGAAVGALGAPPKPTEQPPQ